ncbi:MAG TPA: hypothetical protein VF796_03415 [Humisphaera sp.]
MPASQRRAWWWVVAFPVLAAAAAAPAAAPKPPAPAKPAAKPAAEPVTVDPLDPEFLTLRFHLHRYLSFAAAIRELRKELPAGKLLDAPPLEGAPTFMDTDLVRETGKGKSKAQVLREWTTDIDKLWAARRAELGREGLAKVEALAASPQYQIQLFIECMSNQTLSQMKQLTPAESKAAWAAARGLFDRFYARKNKHEQAVFAAAAKHEPIPANPFDAAALDEYRTSYMARVGGALPPEQQRHLRVAWSILYPKGPPVPPMTKPPAATRPADPVATPAPNPAPSPSPAPTAATPPTPPPTRPAVAATPQTKPAAPSADTPSPAAPAATAALLAGVWTTSKDGLEEVWTVKSDADGWHVSCAYRKGGKDVGSCHGESVKFRDGTLSFVRVFDKRPRDDMPDHSASKIAPAAAGHADLIVAAGGGKTFRKTLTRASGT